MTIRVYTSYKGMLEKTVDSYKEAMDYINQLKEDGITVNEYSMVFNKEAVKLYEGSFQEAIDDVLGMHYSVFEMERQTDVWH